MKHIATKQRTTYTIEITEDDAKAIQIMVGEFNRQKYGNLCERFATKELYEKNPDRFNDIFKFLDSLLEGKEERYEIADSSR